MIPIEDFGNKIGGAKKDLWRLRGLWLSDLIDMNTLERDKYIIKNNIWKKPDYNEMIQNGLSKRVAYYIKVVRDAIPPKPILNIHDIIAGIKQEDISKAQEEYISFISSVRDEVNEIKTEGDVVAYKHTFFEKYCKRVPGERSWSIKEENKVGITDKLFKAVQVNSFYKFDRQIKKKQFGYTEDEKAVAQFDYYLYTDAAAEIEEGKCIVIKDGMSKNYFYPTDKQLLDKSTWVDNTYFITKKGSHHDILIRNVPSKEMTYAYARENANLSNTKLTGREKKKNFIPVQFKGLKRDGIDYRNGKQIKGDDMLSVFSFFGGEFGNYMNETDRLASLNYSYDAFKDLAKALGIDDKDISLNGTLSIAYGARGSGSAMAHYEPMRNVINLTKLRGAGNLAHEWGHALDTYLENELFERHSKITTFPSMQKLINTIFYDEQGNETVYYKNSKKFDTMFSISDKGYWRSREEMFARAFSCYIADKLEKRSDYLCGHSDHFRAVVENESGNTEVITAYPTGKEREKINSSFDVLINEIKEMTLLHCKEHFSQGSNSIIKEKYSQETIQMSLFDDYIDDERLEDNNGQRNKVR